METSASKVISMPEDQYRASAAIARSDLDYMQPPYTPAHFKAHKDGLLVKKETEAMTLGSIVHRAILEPDTMPNAFAVRPDKMKLTTKEGIAWKEEQGDKAIISGDQVANINGMVSAIHNHPEAKRLFITAKTEQSIFDTADGLDVKIRVDILPEKGNFIADIKTCNSADDVEFSKAIGEYGYYRQAYFYLKVCKLAGLDKINFIFCCVEKTPPYAVALYALDDDALDAGKLTIERDLQTVRNCMAENKWPSFPQGIRAISLPPWLSKQLNQQ